MRTPSAGRCPGDVSWYRWTGLGCASTALSRKTWLCTGTGPPAPVGAQPLCAPTPDPACVGALALSLSQPQAGRTETCVADGGCLTRETSTMDEGKAAGGSHRGRLGHAVAKDTGGLQMDTVIILMAISILLCCGLGTAETHCCQHELCPVRTSVRPCCRTQAEPCRGSAP